MWRSDVRRVGGGLISVVVLAPGRRSNIFPAFYIFKYEAKTARP